jgi:pimeloyl-ACP methyl ester carboxylesterase
VEDYNDIGQFYQRMNINFVPVDYRGYGISSGKPTVTSMMSDCNKIFDFVVDYLKSNGFEGAVIIMGRSLGSASVLELINTRNELIDGLIIESGFAFALPLFKLVGIDLDSIGVSDDLIGNHKKIAGFNKPTLIIHAEFDHIIPYSDGECLFNQSPDPEKRMLKVLGANHNDILARGLEQYMQAVKELVERSVKHHVGKGLTDG